MRLNLGCYEEEVIKLWDRLVQYTTTYQAFLVVVLAWPSTVKLALRCASARKSIKQGCRAFLVLVTEDDIARATLAAANVTNSSSTAATSPAVSTACPATAGPEQAGLLQHVDALMLMCLQSPRGCLLTGGWRMSFLYCLTLSLLSSVCTGCLPLRCKRCSGRLLTCCPNS